MLKYIRSIGLYSSNEKTYCNIFQTRTWKSMKAEIANWMETWFHVDIRHSAMRSFCWLMILQLPFPNQEVRWGGKTKQPLAPVTPRQSGCPWQRWGGLCQFRATSVPGGFFELRKMSGGRFGNLPSAQDEWLSTEHTPLLSHSLSPSPPILVLQWERCQHHWVSPFYRFN